MDGEWMHDGRMVDGWWILGWIDEWMEGRWKMITGWMVDGWWILYGWMDGWMVDVRWVDGHWVDE